MSKFKYIYGPVPSWRLGASLGIDLLSQKEKICNFDCVYCQLGKTNKYTIERKEYVPTEEVIKEIKKLPELKIDYFTFSGRGEPTLAKNLGETIRQVKKIGKAPIAVLTNSFLINDPQVRKELSFADFVCVKLDASSPEILKIVNRPAFQINFSEILEGITIFRKEFKGKFALQIMFIEENKDYANQLSSIAKRLNPDEVQINTPLRSSSKKPLSPKQLEEIEKYFQGLNVISVYKSSLKEVIPVSEPDTLTRRGKYIE